MPAGRSRAEPLGCNGAGAQCGRRNLEEEKTEEGSGRRRRSTTDFDERLAPWMNASKLNRVRVAAGQPVSTNVKKGREARPATSRRGCGSGPKPWTETLDVAAG